MRWRSWLVRLAAHRLRVARARAAEQIDYSDPGWRASMRAVEDLAHYCKDRGYGFGLVYYRWHAGDLNEALVSELRIMATANEFPIVDTLPWFEASNTDELRNSEVDSHPNAAGHEILAAGIARFLRDEDLLWPRHRDTSRALQDEQRPDVDLTSLASKPVLGGLLSVDK